LASNAITISAIVLLICGIYVLLRYLNKKSENGKMCPRCGKNPALETVKLCAECFKEWQ
jgi:hypothetical protein